MARLVCICVCDADRGSARTSPRRRCSSAPHLNYSSLLLLPNTKGRHLPPFCIWSKWRDSNLRHPAPKKLWELFSNIFRSFLAPSIPEKLLFRTLVSTVSVYSKPSYGQICGQKPLPLKSRQLFARSGKRFCLCHCSLQSSFNQVISACKNCTAINKEKSFATTEEIKGSFLHVGTRELDYFIEFWVEMFYYISIILDVSTVFEA